MTYLTASVMLSVGTAAPFSLADLNAISAQPVSDRSLSLLFGLYRQPPASLLRLRTLWAVSISARAFGRARSSFFWRLGLTMPETSDSSSVAMQCAYIGPDPFRPDRSGEISSPSVWLVERM